MKEVIRATQHWHHNIRGLIGNQQEHHSIRGTIGNQQASEHCNTTSSEELPGIKKQNITASKEPSEIRAIIGN